MNKIIEIATAEIETKETGNNHTKYGEWFGLQNQPWCAIFVSWCYDKAGFSLGKIDWPKGFASVQNGYNHFLNTRESFSRVSLAVPGDIIIFDWDHNGHCDHTGIFVKDLGNEKIETIEGNTGLHNASNGGEVMRMQRNLSVVKCFVHPKIADKNFK